MVMPNPPTANDWEKYATDCARWLASSKNEPELAAKLDQLERALVGRNDVPADFWDRVAAKYAGEPKPLLKESVASAALNALVLSAQALIRARKK
jgi:hypothetical protein